MYRVKEGEEEEEESELSIATRESSDQAHLDVHQTSRSTR